MHSAHIRDYSSIYMYTPALAAMCVVVGCEGGRVWGWRGVGEGVMKGWWSNSWAGTRSSSSG